VIVTGPAAGGASASGQPSGSTMTDPATQSAPRSVPVRSQAATNIRLTPASACTLITSAARSPAGRGAAGQLTGAHSSWAPASAGSRTHSGNSRS
jgi:hypothetical protein